ncbi:MAG: cysteine desulfurase [Gemmatimonadota bacterium]|nr:MAG: cysteine desulfurase [Gemmatimonadota bacterium]
MDVERVRTDFPLLMQHRDGKPLVYLDNAATTQKPQVVVDSVKQYYEGYNANIHRGVYKLSQQATDAYEAARVKLQRFVNAAQPHEIIFLRGVTEAVNLVAHSFGRTSLVAGDEVVISAMEHHSNIVPWQIVCEATRARLRIVPMTDEGELELDEFEGLISAKTKLVALVHVSNSLGTINPVKEMVAIAHGHNVPVLVDGAQATPHMAVDVQDLDCDFYALSGHKMFGPTGIGILYGKAELLNAMPPYQGGGEMIRSVCFDKTTYAPLPAKFEAGTPNIAGAIGLGAAVDYLNGMSWDAIHAHEDDLLRYATESLETIPGLHVLGTAKEKASVVSFVLDGVHAHDIGTIVDKEGVAIRTGHHCTQPVMERLGVPATARASFAFYNTREEVDALVRAVHRVHEVFS